jgi:SAM-dependent methyltransferase
MNVGAEQARFLLDLTRRRRAAHERQFAALRTRDLDTYMDFSRRVAILDLANGRLRPQYTLLKRAGHRVVGIDLVNRPAHDATALAYRVARWLYARSLNDAVDGGTKATPSDDRLICGNVTALPFRDASFDLVTSVAAFEHFLDVPGVIEELHRVVRPGGLVWACIHLFASPSGGHNVTLTEVPLRTLPRGVDAWDHLRRRRLRFHVPLNEWRRDQFVSAFERRFDVVNHYCALREGEGWLTPTIRAELGDFSEDELTCASYVIVAKKRSAA